MQGIGRAMSRWRNTVPWLILAACILVGYQAVRPPRPATDATALEFSADRAFEHVAVIASSPHPTGSVASAAVRQYLISTLGDLGIETELQAINALDYYGSDASVDVVNVIARVPGTDSTGAIALVAHYDTVPWTTGGNDNSVAVAALLETARALTVGPALTNDVLLIFTDAEEPAPRYGATAFVTQSGAVADIALVVNFEASGGSGASLLAEVNGPESWLIGELSRIESDPAAFSALTATTRLLGDIGTDFDQFRNLGIPGMHFAYTHGSSIYHTERDNVDAVGLGSLQHHGEHALGIARHFGLLDLSDLRGDEASVYFPVRPFFVQYTPVVAVVLMLLAGLGVGAVWFKRPRENPPTASLRAVGKSAGGYAGSIVVGTIVWVVIADARPTLGPGEGYLYFGVLVLAMAALDLRIHRSAPPGLGLGPILVWLVLTAATTFLIVGFSYFFLWPTLSAAVALWWDADGFVQQSLRFGIVALVTLIVTVPVIDILLQFANPRPGNPDSNIPAAVLLPLALALLVTALLRRFWPGVSSTAAPAPLPE
jgi:hypothetical protein